MAYMSQEHKKEIAAMLKDVVPSAWKYSLSVCNHSKIVLRIKSADIDLIGLCKDKHGSVSQYLDLNHYYLNNAYDGTVLNIMEEILKVMNYKNYDNSDIMSDYHNVGHYVGISIGSWDKPFQVKSK